MPRLCERTSLMMLAYLVLCVLAAGRVIRLVLNGSVRPLHHRQVPPCTPFDLVKLLYGSPTCLTRGGIVHVIEYTATPDAAGLPIKCTTPRYHGPYRTTACHCFSEMVCSVRKLERACRAELVIALQLVGILPVTSFLCKVCIVAMALIRSFTDSQ